MAKDEMEFKIGSPIMLLCNLYAVPENGLCNDIYMIVVHLAHSIGEAKTVSSVNKGKYVLIPQNISVNGN